MRTDHTPITDPPPSSVAARNLEAGLLLLGLGAIVLFVSLFLDWYAPGLDAWTVFEVWDIVLALAAIAALVAVAGRMGFGPPRPSSWLVGPAAVAIVVVLFALVNHPPAASGVGNDPDDGLWLALAGAVLMLAGTVLSVARISVALNVGDRPVAPPPATPQAAPPVAPPVGTPPTEPTRRL